MVGCNLSQTWSGCGRPSCTNLLHKRKYGDVGRAELPEPWFPNFLLVKRSLIDLSCWTCAVCDNCWTCVIVDRFLIWKTPKQCSGFSCRRSSLVKSFWLLVRNANWTQRQLLCTLLLSRLFLNGSKTCFFGKISHWWSQFFWQSSLAKPKQKKEI